MNKSELIKLMERKRDYRIEERQGRLCRNDIYEFAFNDAIEEVEVYFRLKEVNND